MLSKILKPRQCVKRSFFNFFIYSFYLFCFFSYFFFFSFFFFTHPYFLQQFETNTLLSVNWRRCEDVTAGGCGDENDSVQKYLQCFVSDWRECQNQVLRKNRLISGHSSSYPNCPFSSLYCRKNVRLLENVLTENLPQSFGLKLENILFLFRFFFFVFCFFPLYVSFSYLVLRLELVSILGLMTLRVTSLVVWKEWTDQELVVGEWKKSKRDIGIFLNPYFF